MAAPAAADALDGMELYEIPGGTSGGVDINAKVDLRTLWQGRRIVLCCLRHLGCGFCHQQIVAMQSIADELRTHDVLVVAVSLGTREQAVQFRVRAIAGAENI